MNKVSTDKERTVRSCVTSENTTRESLRPRYMTMLGERLDKIQRDKKVILESATTDKKRLLLMVGWYDNDVDVDKFVGNSDGYK